MKHKNKKLSLKSKNIKFLNALVLNLLKDILERSKKSFNKFRTSARKKIKINNYSKSYYVVTLLTLNSSILCMHTRLSTINNFKHRTYIITSPTYNNTQKGRKEAYQKWCPIPINWDNENSWDDKKSEMKTYPLQNNTQEDKMAYYKQFMKK